MQSMRPSMTHQHRLTLLELSTCRWRWHHEVLLSLAAFVPLLPSWRGAVRMWHRPPLCLTTFPAPRSNTPLSFAFPALQEELNNWSAAYFARLLAEHNAKKAAGAAASGAGAAAEESKE